MRSNWILSSCFVLFVAILLDSVLISPAGARHTKKSESKHSKQSKHSKDDTTTTTTTTTAAPTAVAAPTAASADVERVTDEDGLPVLALQAAEASDYNWFKTGSTLPPQTDEGDSASGSSESRSGSGSGSGSNESGSRSRSQSGSNESQSRSRSGSGSGSSESSSYERKPKLGRAIGMMNPFGK